MNSTPPIKVYILTFWAEGVNLGALQQYLHDSTDIAAYWNYIPLVYCFKSRLNARELSQKLAPFFPGSRFMIAEINTFNIDGSMVTPSWEWFYLDHHEKVRPPAPVAGFGALGLGALSPDFGTPTLGGLLTPPPKKP